MAVELAIRTCKIISSALLRETINQTLTELLGLEQIPILVADETECRVAGEFGHKDDNLRIRWDDLGEVSIHCMEIELAEDQSELNAIISAGVYRTKYSMVLLAGVALSYAQITNEVIEDDSLLFGTVATRNAHNMMETLRNGALQTDFECACNNVLKRTNFQFGNEL